ncbi:hypothetical protein [Streptosporangium longisporum]|uniref:Uncharacterized protein n=1 Tax=Streptosporangium longisporum TaxID=46187 RepID=A0ABN3XTJ7_9ACTN
MNFGTSVMSVLFMLLGALVQFLVIYFAVRLALKHDRERSGRGGPQV